jgi:hypothetical protein
VVVKRLSRTWLDSCVRLRTASVGLAMFDGLSALEVLACADLAMYEALLRLRNEEGGEPLTPSTFLYVAERSPRAP